jgi:hypothetical protein
VSFKRSSSRPNAAAGRCVRRRRVMSRPVSRSSSAARLTRVSMNELHEREPMTPDDLARWRGANEWKLRWYPDTQPPALKSVPNGYLRISLPPHRGEQVRSNWAEGPRGGLDRKLPAFFAELERRAGMKDDCRAEERRRESELRRQHALEQAERERLQRIEQARVEQLRHEVASWRFSADVREYVEALRARDDTLATEQRTAVIEWCEWALDWAQRNDPSRSLNASAGSTVTTNGSRATAIQVRRALVTPPSTRLQRDGSSNHRD